MHSLESWRIRTPQNIPYDTSDMQRSYKMRSGSRALEVALRRLHHQLVARCFSTLSTCHASQGRHKVITFQGWEDSYSHISSKKTALLWTRSLHDHHSDGRGFLQDHSRTPCSSGRWAPGLGGCPSCPGCPKASMCDCTASSPPSHCRHTIGSPLLAWAAAAAMTAHQHCLARQIPLGHQKVSL